MNHIVRCYLLSSLRQDKEVHVHVQIQVYCVSNLNGGQTSTTDDITIILLQHQVGTEG